jgi:hypothetical protein
MLVLRIGGGRPEQVAKLARGVKEENGEQGNAWPAFFLQDCQDELADFSGGFMPCPLGSFQDRPGAPIAGQVVNWKAAAFPVKSFTSKKGGTLQFFNIELASFVPSGQSTNGSVRLRGVEPCLHVPPGGHPHPCKNTA